MKSFNVNNRHIQLQFECNTKPKKHKQTLKITFTEIENTTIYAREKNNIDILSVRISRSQAFLLMTALKHLLTKEFKMIDNKGKLIPDNTFISKANKIKISRFHNKLKILDKNLEGVKNKRTRDKIIDKFLPKW